MKPLITGIVVILLICPIPVGELWGEQAEDSGSLLEADRVHSSLVNRVRSGDEDLSYTGLERRASYGSGRLQLGWMFLLVPAEPIPARVSGGTHPLDLPPGWFLLFVQASNTMTATAAAQLSYSLSPMKEGSSVSPLSGAMAVGIQRPGDLLLRISAPFSSISGNLLSSPLTKSAGWSYLSSGGRLHGLPMIWTGIQAFPAGGVDDGSAPPFLDIQAALSPGKDVGICSVILRAERSLSQFYFAPSLFSAQRDWSPGSSEEEVLSGTLLWRPGDIQLLNWAVFAGWKTGILPRERGSTASSVSGGSESVELCFGLQQLRWIKAGNLPGPFSPWLRGTWTGNVSYIGGVELLYDLDGCLNVREMLSIGLEGDTCRRIHPFWELTGQMELGLDGLFTLSSDFLCFQEAGEPVQLGITSVAGKIDWGAFSSGGRWRFSENTEPRSLELDAHIPLNSIWNIQCGVRFAPGQDDSLYPCAVTSAVSFRRARGLPALSCKLKLALKHESPGTPVSPFSLMLDGSFTTKIVLRQRGADMNIEMNMSLPPDMYLDRLLYSPEFHHLQEMSGMPRFDFSVGLDSVRQSASH